MSIFIFFSTIVLSFFATMAIIYVMRTFGIVDNPKTLSRKIHKKNIPLGGGLAIFITFFITVLFLYINGEIGKEIVDRSLIGIAIGAGILMAGGLLDDIKSLKPWVQVMFPIGAIAAVIGFGIGPHQITNPLGGIIALDGLTLSLGKWGTFVVFADVLVFLWLMGMMYTTKLLDGLDGLVSGVTGIGALMIFFLTQQALWYQPEVGFIAIAFAGSVIGFLIWNSYPAKIFLGEGGSLFCGFIIGVLAIISGSKIATTLLVLAIPALDLLRVFIMRIKRGKPFYVGDKEHLHFKLLAQGYSQKQIVWIFYFFSFLFGLFGVLALSSQKFVTLAVAALLMIIGSLYLSKNTKKSYE